MPRNPMTTDVYSRPEYKPDLKMQRAMERLTPRGYIPVAPRPKPQNELEIDPPKGRSR